MWNYVIMFILSASYLYFSLYNDAYVRGKEPIILRLMDPGSSLEHNEVLGYGGHKHSGLIITWRKINL